MAADKRTNAGARPGELDIEGTVLRAALLAGYGGRAQLLARRLAAVAEAGTGRSCLDAGIPMQFTVDAPGPAGLRVGIRIGRDFGKSLNWLVPEGPQRHLHDVLSAMPHAAHDSLGTWLFWAPTRQSVFIDVRDPSPDGAYERIRGVLSAAERDMLDRTRDTMANARPWALRFESNGIKLTRVHVHWLLDRRVTPQPYAERIFADGWQRVVSLLGHLLRRPGESGRWVVATPLNEKSEPALRIGNTGWALVPEDDRKQRAVGQLASALGGPREFAEALWSLCRGMATADWRVGRACELKLTADSARARLFLVPQVCGATAGTSTSAPVTC